MGLTYFDRGNKEKSLRRFPGVMSLRREELKLVPIGYLSGRRLPTEVTHACCVIPLVYTRLVFLVPLNLVCI